MQSRIVVPLFPAVIKTKGKLNWNSRRPTKRGYFLFIDQMFWLVIYKDCHSYLTARWHFYLLCPKEKPTKLPVPIELYAHFVENRRLASVPQGLQNRWLVLPFEWVSKDRKQRRGTEFDFDLSPYYIFDFRSIHLSETRSQSDTSDANILNSLVLNAQDVFRTLND